MQLCLTETRPPQSGYENMGDEKMRKGSFLNAEKPLLTVMVQADNPDRIEYLVNASLTEGAEAFGMQFELMNPEYRTGETYEQLFSLTRLLPVYVTNYRSRQNEGRNDNVLAEELIELAKHGATLCDVMGDYFDPCDGELTMNEIAIQKQIKLIDTLHETGAEVLMSSHINKFTPAEMVLEIALEHKRRGADISKIVTRAENMEQQIENLRILSLLKNYLGIPFLFLSGGECHISRRLGSTLGNCMTLCIYEQDMYSYNAQPLLKDAKLLRDTLGF